MADPQGDGSAVPDSVEASPAPPAEPYSLWLARPTVPIIVCILTLLSAWVLTTFAGAGPFPAWQHWVSAATALIAATLADAALRKPEWRRGLLLPLLLVPFSVLNAAAQHYVVQKRAASQLEDRQMYFLSALPLMPGRSLLSRRSARGCICFLLPCFPKPCTTLTTHSWYCIHVPLQCLDM